MAATTTGNIGMTFDEHRVTKFLVNAFPSLHHGRWGVHQPLPKQKGNVVRWSSMPELSESTTALTEDTWATAGYNGSSLPTSSNLSVTHVAATPSNYGAYVETSDDIEEQDDLGVRVAYEERLGRQAAKTVDILTRTVLVAGFTNKTWPGTATADNQLTNGDVLDYKVIIRAKVALQNRNVQGPLNGGQRYVMLTPILAENDLRNDERIITAMTTRAVASGQDLFMTGYLGTLSDLDIFMSSNTHSTANSGASGTLTVYTTIIFGEEAYGTTGISGRDVTAMQLGDANAIMQSGRSVSPVSLIYKEHGWRDPFNEMASIAWKLSHVAKVLNSDNAQVIRHACSS
jgi:N4-gp56 family major capsid protein